MTTEEIYQIAFQLITAAGTAKSNYINAIEEAKKGNYGEAEKLIAAGDEAYNTGHAPHASLVQKEADGKGPAMTLILTHAEDQMMSCEVFKVLAEEMIGLYHEIDELKK